MRKQAAQKYEFVYHHYTYLKPRIMIPDDSEVDRPLCQAFYTEVHICTVPALIVTGEQCSNSRFMLYNSNQAGFIVRL